ncbi:hypothetical protein Aph01nite_28970 [Acrocarpospora phusangensis]|uniref:Uncharacterized protein n=1 Tax=Acrocarpospora phusangensis TaxID=1070424 RepID=A0A919UNK1_9ACTN|nr:hypothetical protein [Acrocarpospora phusangensis]GIH24587.1 hypothetical protein Aph01nite_28970 [Acrocarpospora phusangensis]
MEESAEPVSTVYGRARDSLWINDRIRDGKQRGGLGVSLMGSVPVVEAFLLAQGVPQVALERRSEAADRAERILSIAAGMRSHLGQDRLSVEDLYDPETGLPA